MVQEPRKIMRLPAVMAVTGWSRSTVYDKIKAGKFPKPFKPDPDGRVAGWFEDEIAALQQRAIEHQAAVSAK
jgi:prophage regulatory protein